MMVAADRLVSAGEELDRKKTLFEQRKLEQELLQENG